MPRPSRLLVLVLLGTAFAGLGAGVTHAAFNKTTTNSGDVITGRPDWLPPTVSATAVAKSTGYSANYVKQGGSYYVYANVAEPASNPAAGVASVTADASALTGGATALALITTGGPWTVEGTTYNYRSALQTAGNPLAAGVKTWSLTATDAATPTTNSTTSPGLTANVDNTAPTASSISAANKTGGTQSRPEQGDTITFTYSEPIDPDSILSGWTGASTNVTVRITNATNDSLAVWDTANTTQLPLGSVNLANGGYVSANATFGPSTAATKSTMVLSGNGITITLGTLTAGTATTASAAANMAWTPSASAYDRAGNASTTTAKTETDNDRDF